MSTVVAFRVMAHFLAQALKKQKSPYISGNGTS